MNKSPFPIPPEDIAALDANRGFQVLRSFLSSNDENSFCNLHNNQNAELQDEWLLHRDIIHGLIVPVVELINRASTLAGAALCSDKPEDMELVFRGDARGAFVTLQCFQSEEEDWCYSRGCPACIATEALSTETHIRVLLAALLLSADTVPTPLTPSSPTLPSFSFFLPALHDAVSADPFWGEKFWQHHWSRAQQLCTGLQGLRKQSAELEALVSSPVISPVLVTSSTMSPLAAVTPSPSRPKLMISLSDTTNATSTGEIKLRKSQLAKRQLRLLKEEQALLQRFAAQCWSAVVLPPQMRKEMNQASHLNAMAATVTPPRRRSLTTP